MRIAIRFALLFVLVAVLTPLFAADVTGAWKGDAKVPVNVSVPFQMELHQTGSAVTGTVKVGPATFPILDGKVDSNVVTFSTIHDVRIVDATKTEKMDKPIKFNYTATMNGDKCHISIVHAGDNPGTPNELDVVRAKN